MKFRFPIAAAALLSVVPFSSAQAQKLHMPDAAGQSAPAPQSAPAAPQQESRVPPAGSAEADRPAVPVAEIVARINDNIISKADLSRAGEQLEGDIKQDNLTPEQAEVRRAGLLSDLIDQQLLLSKAKEMNVNGDDEVIRRLDEIRKQYHMDSMEDLEKAATAQGVSFEDFKQNIRNGVLTQAVVRQEVARNLHMTSEEMQAYYRAHRDQFSVPESVHLSEILIPTGDTDASLDEAQKRATKIADDLRHGSDFAAMAKTVSQGPTAAQGGELGQFKRGQLAKELEDKTFALQTNGVTEPIRTRQGFVILKVTDHVAAGVQPYKDVEEQIQQMAYQNRMQPALRVYLTKLREEAFIDIRPGYTDTHASPNESKPVFSAYAPPGKKKDKKKEVKYRFRDRHVMPKDVAPPPPAKPDLEQVKAQPGGPTAVGTKTYQTAENNPPAAPGAAAAGSSAASRTARPAQRDNGKPVKVRYGQNQRTAQLPESATGAATEDTSATPGVQTASAAAIPEADRLSPESRKILGMPEESKGAKTRFSSRPPTTRAQQKEAEQAVRNANAPAPADADETTTRAVTSQPLGLNGDTANVKAPRPTEKQRLQEKKQVATVDKPNPGTPGSADYTPTANQDTTPQTPTKRHKLLGIL